MKRYEDYSTSDFVMDEYFRKWVKTPSHEADEFWEHWMKLHPGKKNDIQLARTLLTTFDFKKTSEENIHSDALLDRIRASIQRPTVEVKSGQQVYKQLLRIAAVFTAVAVVGGLLFLSLREHENPIRIYTAYGKTERITLPDQSVVLLNANSVLSYNDKWTEDKTREVWLTGEAYFEVKKSAAKGNAKFIVHTEQLSVEVLGTEFNVNNRRGKTQVVLNSGKVRLTSDATLEKEIMMAPGEMAELKMGERKFIKKTVDTKVYTSWRVNQIILTEASFKQIMNLIEDTYGYKVVVDESMKDIESVTFTATIPGTELDVLLEILSESYGVRFTKADSTITISR